jgi:hypothetical protein
MPRRPAEVLEKIPLWLIPRIVKTNVIRAGEELIRLVVKKTGRHCYHIFTHTRSVQREPRPVVERAGEDQP